MNEQLEVEEKTETENVISKKEHKRSASYPALNVDESYKFSTRINEKFGSVSHLSREEIGLGLDQNPQSISRDIASCVHYGFLSKTVEGYKLTPLFSDIFAPESEKERKMKLIAAFGTPKLYQELIAKLDNTVIPQELPNTLIKHHNITESAAKEAAKTFIESGLLVGVINDNRLLRYQLTLTSLSKSQISTVEVIEETQAANLPANLPHQTQKISDEKRIPIHLTKDKVAFLSYPSNITENDVQIVEHEIKGILLRIKLEKEEEETIRGAQSPS